MSKLQYFNNDGIDVLEEIDIYDDENSEMLKICRGDKCLFEGNYWDFMNCPSDLAEFLDRIGVPNTLNDYNYDEE